ncbi:hypothetical protein OGZ01_25600 [Vibrio harveyi]|nr:hypothetical protein [Vibrio harveyi]
MYNEYEGRKKIWSMKTDGTDLRLVTDLPWLGKDDSSVGKTSRSPNNRYVAVGYGSFNKLFDIKTQQMIELPHKRKSMPVSCGLKTVATFITVRVWLVVWFISGTLC